MKGEKGAHTVPPAGLDETHACDRISMVYRVSMPIRLSSSIPPPFPSHSLYLYSKFCFHSFSLSSFFPFFSSLRSVAPFRSPEMKSVHFSWPLWNSINCLRDGEQTKKDQKQKLIATILFSWFQNKL